MGSLTDVLNRFADKGRQRLDDKKGGIGNNKNTIEGLEAFLGAGDGSPDALAAAFKESYGDDLWAMLRIDAGHFQDTERITDLFGISFLRGLLHVNVLLGVDRSEKRVVTGPQVVNDLRKAFGENIDVRRNRNNRFDSPGGGSLVVPVSAGGMMITAAAAETWNLTGLTGATSITRVTAYYNYIIASPPASTYSASDPYGSGSGSATTPPPPWNWSDNGKLWVLNNQGTNSSPGNMQLSFISTGAGTATMTAQSLMIAYS